MNKKILFLILLSAVLSCPLLALAVPTIAGMAAAIAGQVVIVGTWIVVIMWVVTGILYLTCIGEPAKLKAANTSLFAAIAGTILIILASGGDSLIKFVGRSFGI